MNAVDSIRLDLPAEWRSLPVDVAELRERLASEVLADELSRLSVVERRRAELFLQRIVADLESSNVGLFALLFEEIEVDPDAETIPLVATCAVSVLDRAALGTNAPLSAEVVLAAMSLDAPDADSRTTATNLEPPAIVELAVGPAVRVVRLLEQQISARDQMRVFTETFFVPVADAFDRLVVAQFSTPDVDDSREFSDLFGALAQTIRFYREGEPTEL